METYTTYKGYGITYFTLTGTTYVNGCNGKPIKVFKNLGEQKGNQKAKEYIDTLSN